MRIAGSSARSAAAMPGEHEPGASGDAPGVAWGRVAKEALRGGVVLGTSLGSSTAVYARLMRLAVAGRMPGGLKPVAALVPALGVGGTAVSDAVTLRYLSPPTDPQGRSGASLVWVSPWMMGLTLAAYRYAPLRKPALGSAADMAAQWAVAGVAGAVSYATREWLAQRMSAGRPTDAGPRHAPAPGVADQLVARTATQVAAVGLRCQMLMQPSCAPRLYLPALVASCLPYGWRDPLTDTVARLRASALRGGGKV